MTAWRYEISLLVLKKYFSTLEGKIYHGSPRKLMSKFTCKICENTGKILKISCVRCHFVKFDINFLGLPWEN